MERNYIQYKVWDEFISPFPNFNGATVGVRDGEVILSHTAYDYLKLTRVSKKSS